MGEKRPDQVQLVASGLSKEPGRMVTDLDAPVLEEPGTPTINGLSCEAFLIADVSGEGLCYVHQLA